MYLGRRKNTEINEEFLTLEQIAEGYCMIEYEHCLCLYKDKARMCIFGLGATRGVVQRVIEEEKKNC